MSSNDHVIKLRDGRNLGYAEYGDPKGKPLFHFHGWPSCRLFALETDKEAKKLGVRVISIDRPGFGLSDFQENRTLMDWPGDVLELADKLEIKKFAVMGVSGGGPYAAVCAYKIPERLTKVGIVVGLAPPDVKGNLEGMAFLNKLGWANYARVPGLKRFSTILVYLTSLLPPAFTHLNFWAKEDKQLISKDFEKFIKRSLKECFRQGLDGPCLDLKLYTEDWGFDIGKIKADVRLFYGDVDKNVSLNMGKYFAKQIKGSQLTIYKGEGHFCRMNHEEEILRKLAF